MKRRQQKRRFVAPLTRPNLIKSEDDEDFDLSNQLQNMRLDGIPGPGGDCGGVHGVHDYESFENMGLKHELLKGIYSYGLQKPALIQKRVIIPMIKGNDVIVQAQSGMGKTAALVIAILQKIDLSNPNCQALILAPTRELSEQITEVFSIINQYLGVSVYACVGGKSIKACRKSLETGKQVIVGTTGRLAHMLREVESNTLDCSSIKIFAMDEADKMLNGEFNGDIRTMLNRVSGDAQMILMSATMPEHILKKARLLMRHPLKFLLKNTELTLDGIKQYYVKVGDESGKLETLADIYNQISKCYGMIFCRTKTGVRDLKNKMIARDLLLSSMSSDLVQEDRDSILDNFRKGVKRLLITTDLLGRGIDVQHVNLVINYDLPSRKEEYIHRVGRSGRYGRKGISITFVTDKEIPEIRKLEEFYSTVITEMGAVINLQDVID